MGGRIFYVLALVAVLLTAPHAAAQTVAMPLQTRTGDVFTVDVQYTQSMEMQEQQYSATMSYLYSVTVRDAEARLWRFMPISVSYQLPEMPGLDAQAAQVNWPAMSDMMSAMLRIGTDVGFDCRVDEHGRCVEMTNWPFWSARIENMVLAFDGMARMIPASMTAPGAEPPFVDVEPPAPRQTKSDTTDVEPEPAAATPGMVEAPPGPSWEVLRGPVLQGVARMIDGFDSRDAASSLAGMYLPAFVQGRTLTRRDTVSFTDEYDMPFGAPALRFNGTMRLDRIDRGANTATITRRSRLDEESARASLGAMTEFVSDVLIQPLAPHLPAGDAPPDAAAIVQLLNTMVTDFGYEETTRGVVDLNSGFARETTTDFTMSVSLVATDAPLLTRGRIVTRVTPSAPATPRLPRG